MDALVYTAAELAVVLQVSESHVRRLAKAGDLPVLPIRGRLLFAKVAIDEMLTRSAA